MKPRALVVAICAFVMTGCYHATIETGLQPSNQTVGSNWASSWIYGLVPPSVLEAGEECPTGVARVETQLSFVNQLVGFLTLGIYTPMEVTATCAQGGGDDSDLSLVDSKPEWDQALQNGDPFLVQF